MNGRLAVLARLFAGLSLMAFGGGNTILPGLQRALVVRHHWMDAADFATLFGLSRAAPGPNLIVVTLLGWRVAGAAGAVVATLATFLPPALLTLAVLRLWRMGGRWQDWLQAGLPPVTAGLTLASALLITKGAATTPGLAAITLGAATLSACTRLNPLWLLAGGAVLGCL